MQPPARTSSIAGGPWLLAAAALLTAAHLGAALLLAEADLSARARQLLQVAAAAAPIGALVSLLAGWSALRRSQQLHQQAEAAMALQREVLDAMQSAVVVWDRDDRLVFANRDFRQVYAALSEHLQPGMRFEDGLRAGIAAGLMPEAKSDPEAWIAHRLALRRQAAAPLLRELPGGRWRLITEQRLSDGSLVAHSIDVSTLVKREQALAAMNAELDKVNAELERLSETDALTGLGNRRLFDRRLADECARASRHGTALALVLVDVDHFKRFNDRHGHPAGDECLAQVARLLEQAARRPGDLVARVGGEEFALLLPHMDAEAAMAQARRCQTALAEAELAHGDTPLGEHITCSIGVAVWVGPDSKDGPALRPACLLAQADAALYEAKHQGRARSVLHGELTS